MPYTVHLNIIDQYLLNYTNKFRQTGSAAKLNDSASLSLDILIVLTLPANTKSPQKLGLLTASKIYNSTDQPDAVFIAAGSFKEGTQSIFAESSKDADRPVVTSYS
jgi:hypothetical protein